MNGYADHFLIYKVPVYKNVEAELCTRILKKMNGLNKEYPQAQPKLTCSYKKECIYPKWI